MLLIIASFLMLTVTGFVGGWLSFLMFYSDDVSLEGKTVEGKVLL